MNRPRLWSAALLLALLVLGGCATRPVNPPITQADPHAGYRLATRQVHFKDHETLVILAFSGGGTRAAAFSFGVLEFLRRTEIIRANGEKIRLLDGVGVITGVSGGSFTALAYGLYGDQLFAEYEQRFLKRDVQGAIIARAFNPLNWGDLSSTGWGRSELAADLYDEILFNGATFADLNRGKGPLILASATDISTGARLVFDQDIFDAMCSNLDAVRLSRAAAASSAVPLVLSPVTLNNYGGTCNYGPPPAWNRFARSREALRTAARAKREIEERLAVADGARRPYLHLFDGGVADNVGMRSVLTVLELMEALKQEGVPTRLDKVRRIAVFVVNSVSSPRTDWDEREKPPGPLNLPGRASSARSRDERSTVLAKAGLPMLLACTGPVLTIPRSGSQFFAKVGSARPQAIPGSSSRSWRSASATAWARLRAPSFLAAVPRCSTTVGTERPMRREISLAEQPSAQ